MIGWFWLLLFLGIAGCSKESSQRTLRVWHFWSEPQQEKAFRVLIQRFEENNPDIRVELTALHWAEGKAKLQIGLASNSPPDIIHLGAEWVAEFAPALYPLDSALAANLSPAFERIGIVGQQRYGLPWTVNARVLFIHRELGLKDSARWEDFVRQIERFHHPPARYGIGLCTSDPHNVLKRDLPFVWVCGAKLLQSVPFAATAGDTRLVQALEELHHLARSGIVEPSRQLDDRLRRGELGAAMSGVWMLADSAVRMQYKVLDRIPGRSGSGGESILSGDCFGIVRTSPKRKEAGRLLTYLMEWNVVAAFCHQVPDAGFPAVRPPSLAALDSLFDRAPHWWPAYAQTLQSQLLPTPPYFLDAEAVTEEVLAALLYGRITPSQAQVQLRDRLYQIERRDQSE